MSQTETFYKIYLSFKGSRFFGWQVQKDFHPTVQGELNSACKIIFKSENIHSVGSGRTDTGVHSLGHVIKLSAPFFIEYDALKRALNSQLPLDVRVLSVESCDQHFLPTNHALHKTYKYLFTNNDIESPFQNDLIANFPFALDFALMQKACDLFIGEHDFKDFECVGSTPSTTIRTIFSCSLRYHEVTFHGILPGHWVFEVTGNGFLKQMVRLMVGTLWNVGRGKTSLEQLQESLSRPIGKRLGIVAPAHGLYKISVEY
jgi:tRNA pseudouridine38-40 synthase